MKMDEKKHMDDISKAGHLDGAGDALRRSQGRLTVIGAGPGDKELITLKAVKALQSTDVVLYDALVNPELLEFAPNAEHIFVGKRKGCYSYQQQQINELIVSRAESHGHVVRLKGGDPFVFGRGAEEMEYAAAYGLEVAMVPGISSSLSVPAMQNIPVTKRGAAESFWVITGTTKEHKLSEDVALAAKSSATVVILMGMSKLSQIVALFKKEGKSEMPIAIIQNGTQKDERVGMGTIASIEKEVQRQALANPAIIVIGEVVRHREMMTDLQGVAANNDLQGMGEARTILQGVAANNDLQGMGEARTILVGLGQDLKVNAKPLSQHLFLKRDG